MRKNSHHVKRFTRLSANTRGRDIIIGDLHGCLPLLYQRLDELKFDSSVDRVLSVGDLVDRGPNSLGALSLLREKWFHSVISNHESMMLTYFGKRPSLLTRPYDFVANGGHWVESIDRESSQYSDLQSLLDLVLDLPMALVVHGGDGIAPYNVVHGDLRRLNYSQFELEQGYPIDLDVVEDVTWSRSIRSAKGFRKDEPLYTPDTPVLISDDAVCRSLNLTYVGHTVLVKMALHMSHVYLDRGAFLSLKDPAKYKLQAVEHDRFCRFLDSSGVPVKDFGSQPATADA